MAPAGTAASIDEDIGQIAPPRAELEDIAQRDRDARVAERQGGFSQNGHVKAVLNVGDQDVGQYRAREDEGKEFHPFDQQQHR